MKIRHLLLAAVSLNADIDTQGIENNPIIKTAFNSIKTFVKKIEGEIEAFFLLYFGKMKDEIFSEIMKAGQLLNFINISELKDKIFGAFTQAIGGLKDNVLKTVMDLKAMILEIISKAFAAAMAMHLDIMKPSGVNLLLNKPEVPSLMPSMPGMPGLPNGIAVPAFQKASSASNECTCATGPSSLMPPNNDAPLSTPEAKLAALQIPEEPKAETFSSIKFDALADLKNFGFMDSVIAMIADIENSVTNPIEMLTKLLKAITTEVGKAFETIIEGLAELFNTVVSGFKSALDSIIQEMEGIFVKFKNFFIQLPEMFLEIIDKYLNIHKLLITKAITYLVTLIKKVVKKVFKLARTVKSKID